MIRMQCPHCDKKLGVNDALAGGVAVCPQCKSKFRVPPGKPAVTDVTSSRPKPVRRTDDEEADEVRIRRRPPADGEADEDVVRRVDEEEDEPRVVRRTRDEVDDEDEEAPRPHPKRKKKRRRKREGLLAGYEPFTIVLFIAIGVSLATALLAILVPALAIVPLILGWAISFGGGIWFLIVAFNDSAGQGLLCMLVPCYSLFYLVSHFEEEKRPFFVQLVGSGLVFVGMMTGGVGLGLNKKPPGTTRATPELIQPMEARRPAWAGLERAGRL